MIWPHVHAPCCCTVMHTPTHNYAIISQTTHAIELLSHASLCPTLAGCCAQCSRALVPSRLHAVAPCAQVPYASRPPAHARHTRSPVHLTPVHPCAHALVKCCVHCPCMPLRSLSRIPYTYATTHTCCSGPAHTSYLLCFDACPQPRLCFCHDLA